MAKKSKDTISFGKLIEELQRSSKQASAAASEGGNAGVSVEPNKTTAKIQKEQLDTLNESVGVEQKQDEKLKTLNEQLEKIERALLGMNKKLEKLPKELSNIGPKFSGIKVKEDDKTARENLSELVGEFKGLFGSVGKGIKSAFEFGKNPIGGIQSGIKRAGTFVADVVGAEAGYTAESDRFATEKIKQENAKREEKGKTKLSEQEEDDLRKSSREKFREIVSKEKELGTVEEKIKESKSYGFKPTEGDIEEKNRVIQEIRQQKREAGLPDFAPVERKKEDEKRAGSEVSSKTTNTTVADNTVAVNSTNSNTDNITSNNTSSNSNSTNSNTDNITSNNTSSNSNNTNSNTSSNTSSKEVEISNKSLQELSLIRKLTEGSLEYDKEAAQYRNTSGREVTSKVTGKDIKKGGFIDFETASDQLSGQSKRVRESAGVPEVELKTSKSSPPEKSKVEAVNAESDNVQSPTEILADNSKADLEVTKESNQIFKDQLIELKLIRQALTGTESISPSKKTSDTGSSPVQAAEEGGPGVLDIASTLAGAGGLAKKAGGAIARGAKAVGKGALATGKGIAKFAGSGAGKVLGATAAVGLGAYTAYQGYSEAEDSKQAKLDEVQAKVDSGELTPAQAAEQRKDIGNTATVEKSSAVGEGTGLAGGAIAGGAAGAKLGALVGSIIPGAGTAIGAGIGTLAGGALGAFAGTKAGKAVGEFAGRGINAVSEYGSKLWAGIRGAPEDIKKYNDAFAGVDKKREVALSPVIPQNMNTGAQVASTSVENADLTREATRAPAAQPVISNNVNNSNTTSFVPVKPSPRPGFTGSALERYTMGVSVY